MITNNEQIAAIINEELAETDFDLIFDKVADKDILFDENGIKNVISFPKDNNPINRIFNHLSKDRFRDYGRFHHYKSSGIALQIIKNKSIQVSSLFSNDANDFAEYTEFFKRVGMFHPLVPKDFQKNAFDNNINPNEDRPSDLERKYIFVLCFTQDNHNEKFWKHYADNDHGVAVGFKFSKFNDEGRHLYDFRDVFYDRGYSFDFYNAIDYKLRKFNKMLFADGIVKFSKFYKRAKYNWENETRLCFHYDAPGMLGMNKFLDNTFPIQTDKSSGRRFIELPLDGNNSENPFFNLTITEVVCGKYVLKTEADEIEAMLKQSFPRAEFWQRS